MTTPIPPEPSEFAKAVSDRVRGRMASHRVNRDQIADAIGVNPTAASRRLNNSRGAEFSLSELSKIAPLFSVEPDELTRQ